MLHSDSGAPAARPTPFASQPMPRPLNVLLIEDSAEIRETLTQSIEASGNMAVTGFADNSAEAIRIIEQGSVGAAVIDLHLKEGSGLLVLAHLSRTGNPGQIHCTSVSENRDARNVIHHLEAQHPRKDRKSVV